MGRVFASYKAAFLKEKETYGTPPQKTTSKAIPTKERELSLQLQEKEREIVELRAHYGREASQKDEEIQSLLHEQTILKEASQKEVSDVLGRLNSFKGRLGEKNQEMEQLRRWYNHLRGIHQTQQENSKTLQRNCHAETMTLQEKLTTAEQELETCRDDLFRVQPVCRVSDASINDAFESLSVHLINWIDTETSTFEAVNPVVHVECVVYGSKDSDSAALLLKRPSAGEYLCRSIVNRYLLEHMFGSNIKLFGLSSEYRQMLATIERGMAALKPPKDIQTVNIWRAETLSALAVTQECTDLREEKRLRWTPKLFETLSAFFPSLLGRDDSMRRFHDQVTVPATTIVAKLQGVASAYRLDMASKHVVDDYGRLTRDELEEVIAIDLETGKTLKPGSAIVGDREGVIGYHVLPLEPSLHRLNEAGSAIELRKQTWLVRLDHGL